MMNNEPQACCHDMFDIWLFDAWFDRVLLVSAQFAVKDSFQFHIVDSSSVDIHLVSLVWSM